MKAEDSNFCAWLRDKVKLNSLEVLNNDDNEELRNEHRKYLKNFKDAKSQVQEWLDKNYPKEVRSLIKNLYIRGKHLEGNLSLNDFINLERLDCSCNKITSLELTGLNQLEKIYCNDNYLTYVNYSSLNPKKLTELNFSDN